MGSDLNPDRWVDPELPPIRLGKTERDTSKGPGPTWLESMFMGFMNGSIPLPRPSRS